MYKPCLLIVEDEKTLRELLEDFLSTEGGYETLSAETGIHALEVMETRRPDLIIADIMMPEMDGFTFYSTVRERKQWTTIPFVFLTAKTEREDILRGKALGVEDYLTKPIEPDELLTVIGAKLKRTAAIREAMQTEVKQLKEQITKALSHELRTPLTYISGYTQLALTDLPQLASTEFRQCLQGIKEGSDQLTGLIDDLLLIFDLDSGLIASQFSQITTRHTNLSHIIEYTTLSYAEEANARNVALTASLPPQLPPVTLCEPYFTNALGRLVSNGIKFASSDSPYVTVNAAATAQDVKISVSDNGIGIAPEDIPLLFQRFRQLNRDHQEQQGLGIGLYIAQQLIQLHQGQITVSSQPGAGSTFTIHLPIMHNKSTSDLK